MDISRENEYLLYLAVQSVRGGRVMTLPEGQDYASLFSRAGQAGVFRAVAGGCGNRAFLHLLLEFFIIYSHMPLF